MVSQPLHGMFGPQGVLWMIDVYPDRAEIHGMNYAFGNHADGLEEVVEACVAG